jgi:hypothetical protein
MAKICYQKKRFQGKTLETIERANGIIDGYLRAGYKLTVRQLHYQMVVRNWRENTERQYQNLSAILSDARYAGLVDWEAIEDRGRPVHRQPHWSNPGDILKSAAESFTVDKWAGQPYQPEVWIEKDALTGVIEDVCRQFDVAYFACKGYASTSCAYEAAQRLNRHYTSGRLPIILYLGDFDPSGEDMSRDLIARMDTFGVQVQLRRLALNREQIQRYNPPPQMVKDNDARSKKFMERNGGHCWELDALGPDVIIGLIRSEIKSLIDVNRWRAQERRQAEGRELLAHSADDYAATVNEQWLI